MLLVVEPPRGYSQLRGVALGRAGRGWLRGLGGSGALGLAGHGRLRGLGCALGLARRAGAAKS